MHPDCIFTEEFKREVIKLLVEQGLRLAEASRKLDVATFFCEHRLFSKR